MGFLDSIQSLVQGNSLTGATSPAVSDTDTTNANTLSNLVTITSKSQRFIDKSLMGRGLTVSRFSAANPGKNWQSNFPYRFLIMTVDANGKYSSPMAEFRLPINPQSLDITTPFAIKTTVTSRGILEEHNGVPIKGITLTGTTGMMIDRQPGTVNPTGLASAIFGGTLAAANNAINQTKTASSLLGFSDPTSQSTAVDPTLIRTGYYQYRMLDLFLTTYAEAKKTPGMQNLRLIFEIAKSNVQYIVTPVNIIERRSVQSPMEYIYSIQLLAWGTVPDFKGTSAIPDSSSITNNLNDFQKALATLTQLRTTVQSYSNIISAAQSDVETNIFGPINQAILLLKDTLSIPLAIADMPKTLRDSFQASVVANWNALSATNEDLKNLFGTKMQAIINEGSGASSYPGATSVQAGVNAPSTTFKSDVLDDINLTSSIQLDQLQLNNAQQIAVSDAVSDSRNTSINQINTLISNLQSLSDTLEPQIETKNAMDDEWDILYSLSDSISSLYTVISNGNLNSTTNEDENGTANATLANTALSFWEQTAANAGIDFTAPLGKFSVPFPYKASLEQVAFTYLGDATRWLEIAALNGLQAPYVDEDGFVNFLLGNGSENQINIASDANLYVNQTVYLSSNTQLTSARKIQAISQVSDSNFLITLDGPANMDLFTTEDNAQMLAYLPYTVNSMTQVYIPTDSPPAQDQLDTPPITFLNDDQNSILFSKIDWLLTPQGDLAVTQNGFINLAYGKTNLFQAAKMKLTTTPGGLMLHPEYGAGISVGDNFAEVNLDDLSKRIDQSFRDDSRFLAPASINLQASPTILQESVVAVVANTNGTLPITLPITNN